MKKTILMFALLVTLSVSVFADDGTTHSGGKSCPPGVVCSSAEPVENPVLVDIFDFLKSIFG
jgi:hypothetical protein